MSQEKKRLTVAFENKSFTVAWYPGGTDAAIDRAVRLALDVPESAKLVLRDGDGDVLTLSDSLPSGLQVTAHLVSTAPAPAQLITPPGPKPYPLVGNLFQVMDAEGPLKPLGRLAREHGDFFRLKVPTGHLFVCSDAAMVEEMLSHPDVFQKTIPERSPLGNLRAHSAGDGLFTSADTEEAWQVGHRVLLPAFGMGALKQYYPRFAEVTDDLMAHLERLGEGQSFLATDVMTRMTFEAIAYAGFSTRFHAIESVEPLPFVEAMVAALTSAMASPGQILPDAFHPIALKKREQADATLRETVDRIVRDRRATMASGAAVPNDMLQLMLTTRDKVTGKQLTDENIRYQLITFLVAGHETTSGLLSYALYYLSKNPEAEARLIEEVDRVLGRDYSYKPTFHDIDKLDYTLRVLKECLRLDPTAPAFQKTALRDTTLGGKYAIAKGSPVLVLLPALHRNTRYWGASAEQWNPDNFLPEAVAARHPNAYHPFGLGVRSCIGFQFALIEARLVLARFYQRFQARTTDPKYTLQHVQTLTMKPRDLRLTLARRTEEPGKFPVAAATPREAPMAATSPGTSALFILYGSNMGTCKDLADDLARDAAARGFQPTVAELDAYTGKLPTAAPVVIVTSTYNGAPPDNAVRFHQWLGDPATPADAGKGVRFTVLGAGNKQWRTTFQKFPRFIAERLVELGAAPFHALGTCDADGDFDAAAESFRESLWPALREAFGAGSAGAPEAVAGDDLLYEVELVNFAGSQPKAVEPAMYPLQEAARPATVLKNAELQSSAAERSTRHIEVAVPEGAVYSAGDHLGVFPENPSELVEEVARRCGLRSADVVVLRERGLAPFAEARLPTGTPLTVRDLLTYHVDLLGPVTRKELRAYARNCPCPPERGPLEELASDAKFKTEVLDARLHLLDVLARFRSIEVSLALLLSVRPLIKPRYYSISSSPRELVHACSITVGVHNQEGPDGRVHEGLCSHYLSRCEPGTTLRVVVKDTKSTVRLPADPAKDVILIGPGTGLAPLRGFIQERAAQRRSGVAVGKTWLFFGCRRSDHDYLYQRELEGYRDEGVLSGLDVAFSRQPEQPRAYVQDRVRAREAELSAMIAGGGYVYVCGDAKHMAPDVQRVLAEILGNESGLSPAQAALQIEALKSEGRYLEDVWAAT